MLWRLAASKADQDLATNLPQILPENQGKQYIVCNPSSVGFISCSPIRERTVEAGVVKKQIENWRPPRAAGFPIGDTTLGAAVYWSGTLLVCLRLLNSCEVRHCRHWRGSVLSINWKERRPWRSHGSMTILVLVRVGLPFILAVMMASTFVFDPEMQPSSPLNSLASRQHKNNIIAMWQVKWFDRYRVMLEPELLSFNLEIMCLNFLLAYISCVQALFDTIMSCFQFTISFKNMLFL